MSLGSFAISQDAVSAQPLPHKMPDKTPPNRQVTAFADQKQVPEPR